MTRNQPETPASSATRAFFFQTAKSWWHRTTRGVSCGHRSRGKTHFRQVRARNEETGREERGVSKKIVGYSKAGMNAGVDRGRGRTRRSGSWCLDVCTIDHKLIVDSRLVWGCQLFFAQQLMLI